MRGQRDWVSLASAQPLLKNRINLVAGWENDTLEETLGSCRDIVSPRLSVSCQKAGPCSSVWRSQLRKVSTAIKEQSPFIKHDFSVSPHTPEKKEMGLGVEKKG